MVSAAFVSGRDSLGTYEIVRDGDMKKQELIEFIVEILKARSTVAAIDYGLLTSDQLSGLTRDQLSWLTRYQLLGLTVDTLEAIKERLESEEVEE